LLRTNERYVRDAKVFIKVTNEERRKLDLKNKVASWRCYSKIRSARASVPTSSSQVKVVAEYKSRSALFYGSAAREFTDAADFRTTNRGWPIIPHTHTHTGRTLSLTIITSGQAANVTCRNF